MAIFFPRMGIGICGIVLLILGLELQLFPFSTDETYSDKGVERVTSDNRKISRYFIIAGLAMMIVNVLITGVLFYIDLW